MDNRERERCVYIIIVIYRHILFNKTIKNGDIILEYVYHGDFTGKLYEKMGGRKAMRPTVMGIEWDLPSGNLLQFAIENGPVEIW